MSLTARYVHTNLIAQDSRALASFYAQVFGCRVLAPERDLRGEQLEAATAVPGAHLTGAHLRLPGWGEDGPTLEIFSYAQFEARGQAGVNRPGYGHIAFAVDDVAEARQAVLAAGGRAVGAIVTTPIDGARSVTWCYVTDPEGNVIELQRVNSAAAEKRG